jgi:hypothetical protein
MKLEYPITDAVPSIEHTRDRFLAQLFDYRKHAEGKDAATDEDYELLYAYGKFAFPQGVLYHGNTNEHYSIGYRSDRE